MGRSTFGRALVMSLLVLAGWASGAVTPVAPAAAVGAFEPLPAPQRVLDTRPGASTADGAFAGIGRREGGSTLVLPVAGRVGVPVGAASVVLNVTVTGAEAQGYATVHACDQQRPNTSNVNYAPGTTVANAVFTRLGADGTVCLFVFGATHLIVDVTGVLPADGFAPLAAPQRLLDTRAGASTVDGQYVGIGARPGGSTLTLQIAGRGDVPPGAASVVINVTVADTRERGYVTVHPCEAALPNASNLNYEAGEEVANAVVARLDPGGTACLHTFGATNLIVDVTGVLPAGSFAGLGAPQRLADTRVGASSFDGQSSSTGPQEDGTTLQLRVAGRAGVPADASAVVLNVTATGSPGGGYLTVHPRGSDRPNASNLNFGPGQTIANLVVARVGGGGDVCLFSFGATEVIVDVAGWLVGPAPAPPGPECPSGAAESAASARSTLLQRPGLHRTVGNDLVAVWVCEVPSGSLAVDGAAVAAWANEQVAPYFAEVSGGRYGVQFANVGRIPLASGEGPDQCLDRALAATGAPFTNVLATDTSSYLGGFASPGLIPFGFMGPEPTVLSSSPNTSLRGAWVGGGSTAQYLNPAVVVHEIGHTLHWPHSYLRAPEEYDNPVDVMSGEPDDGWCSRLEGVQTVRWPCVPQHTLAFNRFASDWLGDGQVVIHGSGTENVVLGPPADGGVQMVALPDPGEPRSMLTIEARPRLGRDQYLGDDGVALHVVDQVPRDSSTLITGISSGRRQKQAFGASRSYDHVLAVGESVQVHGVTVRVLSRSGSSFVVQVAGTYRMPSPAFFESTGTGDEPVSCAVLPLADALANGCTR